MILILAFAVSTFLFSAAATDTSDGSQFLAIDSSFDHTPVGEWRSVSKENVGDSAVLQTGEAEEKIYVNKTAVAYNAIDLSDYTTAELVVFILNNHRSMASMLHFSKTDDPYEEAKSYYHGLTELEQREDAVKVLCDAYSVLSEAEPTNDTEQTVFRMRLQFLTLLLDSSAYRAKADYNQISQLSIIAEEPIQQATADYPALMISYGFYYDYASTLNTYGLKQLYLYSATSDHTDAKKLQIRQELIAAHQQAVLMGEATSAYNGYSYAIYQQSVNNPYCIFDIDNFLADPHVARSYVNGWDECEAGDIIIYFDSDGEPRHAGVIHSTSNGKVYAVSKWDATCLFKHELMDVPESFYIDYSQGQLSMKAYIYTLHTYSITSYNSSKHTYSCTVCNKTYSEAHISDGLGGCRICDYQGLGGVIMSLGHS